MASKTRRPRKRSFRYSEYFITTQVAGGSEVGIMMTDEQRDHYNVAVLHATELVNSDKSIVARVYENGILMTILRDEN
jgi:hypothetical protein